MASAGTLTVSVALCTHNGERFIREQLESILVQHLLPREIVISDDRSTDATLEIATSVVDAFVRENPEVQLDLRILRNPVPLGVIRNFEQALRACTGDLVALCDQDDVWTPDRLAVVLPLFQERPGLLLVHSDADLIDSQGRSLGRSLFRTLAIPDLMLRQEHDGDGFAVLLRRNTVTGAATVIRRSLVNVAAPFPESWVHDEWLAIVASAVGEIDVLTESLVGYRQHDSNQIGVRGLSIRGKLRRLVEPGGKRNRTLLARAQALQQILTNLGEDAAPGSADAAAEKLRHEQVRNALPKRRLARLGGIIREFGSGRYTRFGLGLADAARDVLQPTRD